MEAQKKRTLRNDVILIVSLLAVIAIAAACLFLLRGEGDRVEVTVDGKLFGSYSLQTDQRIEIPSEHGFNLLVIEGGAARVEEASCPDGICAAHRPIKRDGESIICLPNKVVVSVYRTDDARPDIIS